MARKNRPKLARSVPRKGPAAVWNSSGLRGGLLVAALLAAVFLVYQPVWNGGFIWDDDAHITKPELRSWHGLYRIWFDLGATQQYYPLLHSAFWCQYQLFGMRPMGYHLVNILLHGTAAVMVALVLRRLAIPGAYLAAAIFALHPVCVESVAWITEQKNTLSAVFYLGTALVYLRFDETRRAPQYLAALALFGLALSCKTVTATLPGALLVIFWWQRGRLLWKKDVLPLVPFFSLGAVAGVFTAWVERKLIGAEGAAFEMSLLERGLLAGRVIWFYLSKLVWPVDLLFFYPRWQIDAGVWWQYLFPAAALAMVVALWGLRRRWRAPLAGILFFVGTLFPVLGFFNVYPFIYSFVADHFQYLASLGMIVLASAGAALVLRRWGWWKRPAGYALCLALLGILASVTWQQSRMYANIETLYSTTVARNPTSWIALSNLSKPLIERGRYDEAKSYLEKALQIQDFPEAHINLGLAFEGLGQGDEAIVHYQRALQLKPTALRAYYGVARILLQRGQFEEAKDYLQKSLQIEDSAETHVTLGFACARLGREDEAMVHYQRALQIDPVSAASSHNYLGSLLIDRGQKDQALGCFREALRCDPNCVNAHINLANILGGRGQVDEAIAHYQKAIEIDPNIAQAHNNLGFYLAGRGEFDVAITHYEKALNIEPGYNSARQNLKRALLERANRIQKGAMRGPAPPL